MMSKNLNLKCTLLLTLCFFAFKLSAQQSKAYFIQIATFVDPQYKHFKKISSVGYLYTEDLESGLSRVIMGTFSDKKTADRKLASIKSRGFKDAYVFSRKVEEDDAVYAVQMATLRQSDDIYWPRWTSLSGEINVQLDKKNMRIYGKAFNSKKDAEKLAKTIKGKGYKDVFIRKVSKQFLHNLSDFEMQRSSSYKKRKVVVQQSVKDLQRFLADRTFLTAKVDGKYGNMTKSSISKFKIENNRYQNYILLTDNMEIPGLDVAENSLQATIDKIGEDAEQAAKELQKFRHPMAKVFLAYLFLSEEVEANNKSEQVNTLMNTAIKQVFNNYDGETRYDFTMSYAYDNTLQLFKHMKAIYEVVKDAPALPCWLINRHPKEIETAFQPYWNSTRDDYMVSPKCGSFYNWEEVRTLIAISKDFASEDKQKPVLRNLNMRYSSPQILALVEREAIINWNMKLWDNLEQWSNGSPMQKSMYDLIYFAYHDAQIRMERHFMDKGLNSSDARYLALQTLKDLVGCNLDEYCGK